MALFVVERNETLAALGSVDPQPITTKQSSPGQGAVPPRWSRSKAKDAFSQEQGSDFSFVTVVPPSTSSYH